MVSFNPGKDTPFVFSSKLILHTNIYITPLGEDQAKKLDKKMTYAYFHPAKVEKVTCLSRKVAP
jgi:hypothetical protein